MVTSPIEKSLMSAIARVQEREDSTLIMRSQVEIGPYRVDILLEDRAGPVLVIECDGHDFHDRTKEQAARDRRRDREILEMEGLITIRFTGREIWRDPEDCALYCVAMAEQLSYRASLETVGERHVFGEEPFHA